MPKTRCLIQRSVSDGGGGGGWRGDVRHDRQVICPYETRSFLSYGPCGVALALNLLRGGRSPAANGVGTGEFWAFWAKTLQKAAEMDGKVRLGVRPGHSSSP